MPETKRSGLRREREREIEIGGNRGLREAEADPKVRLNEGTSCF